ncbi:MAG: segregation/condensation protein A [bacterium]
MKQETIRLQLDVFEGPFELLLYLIKKNDLEISRVSLSQVTDQYLQYLDTLQELNIDLASEFLFMAAELAHIKSRMLLPNETVDADEELDPVAADLIAKLREYEQYKLAAMNLKEKHWLNRDIFTRGAFIEEEHAEKKKESTENDSFEVDAMELIKAFSEVLERLPKEKREHHVLSERLSVSDRLYEVLDKLKEKESVIFTELFEQDITRMGVVITFLAILELTRLHMVRIYQTGQFDPIRIQRRLEMNEDILDNTDMLQNAESYR